MSLALIWYMYTIYMFGLQEMALTMDDGAMRSQFSRWTSAAPRRPAICKYAWDYQCDHFHRSVSNCDHFHRSVTYDNSRWVCQIMPASCSPRVKIWHKIIILSSCNNKNSAFCKSIRALNNIMILQSKRKNYTTYVINHSSSLNLSRDFLLWSCHSSYGSNCL